MKKNIFILVMLFYSANLLSQRVAYYDALHLRKIVEQSGKFKISPETRKILEYYFNTGLTDSQLADSINKNPFLRPSFAPSGAASVSGGRGAPGLASIVGGLDVTNIAKGVSQFMIERAKEELTIAFFNRFKKFAEENEEFRVLFPVTTDNLDNLLSYQYPDMLPALRTGFLDDLSGLTYHLDDVLELPKYHDLLFNFPEIRVAIRSIRVIHELESDESNAALVIKRFAEFPEWSSAEASADFKNFGSSVLLAQIFSQSLRKEENDQDTDSDSFDIIHEETGSATSSGKTIWINLEQIIKLTTDTVALRLYTGLIYERSKKEAINFFTPAVIIPFHKILEQHKENLFLVGNKITEFVELANKVDRQLTIMKENNVSTHSVTNDDLYNYIDLSLDVIEYSFSIGKLFDNQLQPDKYCQIARFANELYRNIYQQEYTQAVTNAMDILEEVEMLVDAHHDDIRLQLKTQFPDENVFKVTLDKMADDDLQSIRRIEERTTDTRIKSLLNKYLEIQTSSKPFEKFNTLIAHTTKYGLFMANVVNAESPEEVSAILESTVLPVGSSSIKKNSTFNIAVQSYLGGYGGLNASKLEENSSWESPFGLIAPIGVGFSAGFEKAGSLSLFISLLDLGAIVDYQLTSDVIETPSGPDSILISKDYSIRLGQIFSPGYYLVWGLPCNLPLSIGIGRQYGPGLGKIEESGSPVVNNPTWRTNIFLAVDIPLFNLVNVYRRYQPD